MPESPELPPSPRPEAGASSVPEHRPAAAEAAGVQAELPPPAPAAGLPAPIPPMPVPDPSAAGQPLAQPAITLPADFPEIAEDNDLIEQEWVEKAKEIVERTKADPHEQNKEINKVKADYIRKRYNREIKITEA